MDSDSHDLTRQLVAFLDDSDAIAYIMIHRHIKNIQNELPAPIGRDPMDRITITAATHEMQRSAAFFLQSGLGTPNFKLIACNRPPFETRNLFRLHEDYALSLAPLSGSNNREPELLVG